MRPLILVMGDRSLANLLRDDIRDLEAAFLSCDTDETKAEHALRTRSIAAVVVDVDHVPLEPFAQRIGLRSPSSEARPVLALTSSCEVSDRIALRRAGASESLAKPVHPRMFAWRLRSALGSCSSRRLPGEPARVLFVEDSRTYQRVLGSVLQDRGHDLAVATSGESALSWAQLGSVDAVVIDLHLPGMDGAEVIARIRAMAGNGGLVVLGVTGSNDAALLRRAREAGANDVLLKTHRADEIADRLSALLAEPRTSTLRTGAHATARDSTHRIAPASGPMIYPFFARVVVACGLSTVTGAVVVETACRRVGISAGSLTPGTLPSILPEMEALLGLYVPLGELPKRMANVRVLLAPPAARSGVR